MKRQLLLSNGVLFNQQLENIPYGTKTIAFLCVFMTWCNVLSVCIGKGNILGKRCPSIGKHNFFKCSINNLNFCLLCIPCWNQLFQVHDVFSVGRGVAHMRKQSSDGFNVFP